MKVTLLYYISSGIYLIINSLSFIFDLRSQSWQLRTTALFMTDLHITWSNFSRQFVAKVTTRTIVTENPHGKEVDSLLKYASTAPIEFSEIVDHMVTALPDGNTV